MSESTRHFFPPGLKLVAVSMLLAATACPHGASVDAPPTAASQKPAEHHVKIENMKYDPAAITVELGDSVIFENRDLFPHTVTSQKPGDFDSGAIEASKSWRLTPSGSGALYFHCTFHPGMEGRITVLPKHAPPPNSAAAEP